MSIIEKNLICKEDIALGKGKVTQSRAGVTKQYSKVDFSNLNVENVVDYGASAEAAANVNTTAFRAAMEAAASNNSGFYVPDVNGTFNIDGYVIIPKEVKRVIIDGHVSMEGQDPTGFYPDTNEVNVRGMFIAGTNDRTVLSSLSADIKKGDRAFNIGANPDVEAGDILIVMSTEDYTWGNIRKKVDENGDTIWSETTANSDRWYYRKGEFAEVRTVSETAGFEGDIFTYKLARDDYEAATTEVSKLVMHEVHISGTGKLTGINDLSANPPEDPTPLNREVIPAVFLDQCRGSLKGITVEECSQVNIVAQLCYQFYVEGVTVNQWTYRQPSDNVHYAIQVSGCEEFMIHHCSMSAAKHAVAIGLAKVGSPVNRDVIVDGCILKSIYNYAADMHGLTEYCTFQNNVVIGGFVVSGSQNRFINNLVYPNWNGVAYYVSELITADHVIDGDLVANVGKNASGHGLFSIGGNSLRGFTAGMRRGGTFRISNFKVRWNKGYTGTCDLSHLNDDKAACEAAGGTYIPANPETGDTAYCSIESPTDQLTCEAPPYNGTWEEGGSNIFMIRGRGYTGNDVKILLDNIEIDSDNAYNYIYFDNVVDNNGRGYYQDQLSAPIAEIEIRDFSNDGGGMTLRDVGNVRMLNCEIKNSPVDGIQVLGAKSLDMRNVRVTNTDNYGIITRDIEEKLYIDGLDVTGSVLGGFRYLNALRDIVTERLPEAIIRNVKSYGNNKNGIDTPDRNTDAAVSLVHISNLILDNVHAEMDNADATEPSNVPFNVRQCNNVEFRGVCTNIFKGEQRGLFTKETDKVEYNNNKRIIEVDSTFLAKRGVVYHVDTSAGGVTATLTLESDSFTKGDIVEFVDIAQNFAANPLTIDPGTSTIDGSTTDEVIYQNSATVAFYYDGSGWVSLNSPSIASGTFTPLASSVSDVITRGVESVTQVGVGEYQVTLRQVIPNARYTVLTSCGLVDDTDRRVEYASENKTSTSFKLVVINSAGQRVSTNLPSEISFMVI